ncbi:39S ribosomal protein L9, mitochondrial [Anthophora quadrimaculata]
MLKCTCFCVNYLKTQSTFLSNQTNVIAQQTRNTFILKRKHPPGLHKKYERTTRLTHKHFIYELVEDTNTKKQKMIDVILLKTIEEYGEKGQMIKVPSIKGYETLILPKLATYASPENIKKYFIEDAFINKDIDEHSSRFVERTMTILSHCYLRIRMSLDVPWTIEKWHIRTSFRRVGIIVPEDAITLPKRTISGPDMSIENKEFYVTVKINNCEEVKVRCKIHHYTSDPKRMIIYDKPIYQLSNIAIFPEDQPILDSLPKHYLYKQEINDVIDD